MMDRAVVGKKIVGDDAVMVPFVRRCVAVMLIAMLALPAWAVPYSTSGLTTGAISPSADTVTLAPLVGGNFTPGGIYPLNDVTLFVFSSTPADLTTVIIGFFAETLTVNGDTVAISIPYKLEITETLDRLTIFGGPTYLVGGIYVHLLDSVPTEASANGDQALTAINAEFGVPEPGSFALLGGALLGFGVLRRRAAGTPRGR